MGTNFSLKLTWTRPEPALPNLGTDERTAWRAVFNPRSRVGQFFVRRPYQWHVIRICQGVAHADSYQPIEYSWGPMVTCRGGTIRTWDLLDGQLRQVSVFWPDHGQGHGLWLNGRRAMRYCLYRLGVPQPPAFRDESTVPAFNELESEVRAQLALRALAELGSGLRSR